MLTTTELLRKRPPVFPMQAISELDISEFCLSKATSDEWKGDDTIRRDSLAVAEGRLTTDDYRREAVEMFYRVGLVGLKLDASQPITWSINGRRTVSTAEIHPATRIAIHRAFWRVLGIREGSQEAAASE